MAFLIQNENGTVEGANAYISVEFFDDYHADQGTTPAGSPTEEAKQQAIVRATRYMDGRFGWIGTKQNYDQTTAWPRTGAVDADDIYRTGIPREVMEACAEYAKIALTTDLNPIPAVDETGQRVVSKSEAVGPISTSVSYAETASGSGYVRPIYPVADNRLRAAGLLRTTGRVYRG